MVLTGAHLINRTPSSILKQQTPYEILFASLPSYNSLKLLGVCVSPITNELKMISSVVEVENASLWVTPLEKKDGNCLIWTKNFLYLVMLNFLRIYFHTLTCVTSQIMKMPPLKK